ncbi:MAG: hypothetical protein H8D23_34330 [Candidatus Brocadiales bacterium]|nr:hypothetical protein [Candidatus Brocadiales bacterium]
MKCIFISGSMRIKNINKLVIDRIENIIREKFTILVGDADGADASIQQILAKKSYENVKVYCTGNYPRNNIGKWELITVQTNHEPKTRLYFTAKDIEMAKHCDYGLMVWDSKSTGTLSNVYELLVAQKTSVVFVNKLKKFINISNFEDFEHLVSIMSDSAFEKANKKINLKEKIISNKNKQLSLSFDK